MEDCLFCKIVKKEINSKILYEDEEVLAFLDLDQTPTGHTLVIPKKHFTDYMELDEKTLWKMFEVAKKLQGPLMEKLEKPASTLLMNYGDAQAIKHVHMHIMPHVFHEKKSLNIDEVYDKVKDEF